MFGDHRTLFAEDKVFNGFWPNEVKSYLGVIRGHLCTPYESWASAASDQVWSQSVNAYKSMSPIIANLAQPTKPNDL